MKNFNLPGIQSHFFLNTYLLELKANKPEYFYPDVNITSVYGAFQYCIWDGGRNFPAYTPMTEEEMLTVKEAYDHYGVPIRFVFTNPLIEEVHLHNRFCNLQLELFHEEKNEIAINSPLLEDYIRTNYPKYKFISSTTKRITNPDLLIKELEKPQYYQVCLDYDLNKNMDLLNSIPKELRSKCEFLANAICQAHCPDRKGHYAKNGQAHMSYLKDRYAIPHCSIANKGTSHPDKRGKGNNLSIEDIDKYQKMGYKYFKLEGRTFHSMMQLYENLYYLIKPEWYWEILSEVIGIEGVYYNCPNNTVKYQRMEFPYLAQNIGL